MKDLIAFGAGLFLYVISMCVVFAICRKQK